MSDSLMINLNCYALCTMAEGPGKRFCLWVQGCLRNCPGCCNAHMQPLELHCLIPVDELCRMIEHSEAENNLEGITLLGGEPMLQASSLSKVAHFAQSRNLSVMTFTGAVFADCTEVNYPGSTELLKYTDVLIDGDFRQDCIDETRNWIGSTNQVFHYLTNRYDSSIETDERYHGLVELRVLESITTLNGCPKSLSDLKTDK